MSPRILGLERCDPQILGPQALTNRRQARAGDAGTVWAAADDRVLTLEVRDDGVGGANPDGHGLMGIADRVDALRDAVRGLSTVRAAVAPVFCCGL